MTNHRRRMQTRSRGFGGVWPEDNNRRQALRKAHRRLDRRYRELAAQMRRLGRAAAQAADAMRGFPHG